MVNRKGMSYRITDAGQTRPGKAPPARKSDPCKALQNVDLPLFDELEIE
ncbi:TPA: hypothetical protein N2R70_003300 [Citrobacter freundii]|nr:hypothetical protein [Citrobacter freundii]